MVAVLLGLVSLMIGLGFAAGVVAVGLLAVGFGFMAWLCKSQIGGQTGDVLGALEQICEIVVLLVAAAAVSALR
jgi:adenosylcobinamide-GDP ribazoletransferase